MKALSSLLQRSSAAPNPIDGGSVRMGRAKVFFYDNPDSDHCVLVFPDADGVDGGRVKENCIKLSSRYKVVLVDLNSKNDFPPSQKTNRLLDSLFGLVRSFMAELETIKWLQNHNFEVMRPQIDDFITNMQREHGVTKFALMGYTWGAIFAAKYCSFEGLPISCGILICPTGYLESFTVCSAPDRELGQQVHVPQLLLCARDEFDAFKPGQQVETDLKSRPFTSEVRHFPDMQDRWFSRGDLADPQVARDVQAAWDEDILPFLAENLQLQSSTLS
ncbi:hypothetical protein AC1031_003543 [Aphanomyces cochlioides]|nr:hypothetical protein AC1031_003543 [Aphanomyces cochlioides]